MKKQTKAERALVQKAYHEKTKHLKRAPCYLIYKVTNKNNGNFYIGLTKNHLKVRFKQHQNSAACGRKGRFMSAIRKHGIMAFEIQQIDIAPSLEEANKKEAHHIFNLKPEYNLTSGGDGTPGFSRQPTIATKKKMSKARTKAWQNPKRDLAMRLGSSVAQRGRTPPALKSGAIHKGRDKYWTYEKRLARQRASNQSRELLYRVQCPDGLVIAVKNLAAFCRDRNLDHSNLNNTAPGRNLRQYKGYKLLEKGVRDFVSITAVAKFLKISKSSATKIRDKNPVMYDEAVQKMKLQKIIPESMKAFPSGELYKSLSISEFY